MLPLQDAQVRLLLLNHIAAGLKRGSSAELREAGIDIEQLQSLKTLCAEDLHRLAKMRVPAISVTVDTQGLRAGLRALNVINEARALEDYFIVHGASWRQMKSFFKMRHKLTLQRRLELGVRRAEGRMQLPTMVTRERIWRTWARLDAEHPRDRIYRLHQAFPHLTLEALDLVITELERDL
jgi:hypothetical protein